MNGRRRHQAFPQEPPVVSVHVERLVIHDAVDGLRHEDLERSIRISLLDLLGTSGGDAAAPGPSVDGQPASDGAAGVVGRAVAPAVAGATGLRGTPVGGSRP